MADTSTNDAAQLHAAPTKARPRGFVAKSFAVKVTLAFMAVAVMTAVISAGVLSFVWEQHFQSYTRENMERLAMATADRIAEDYAANGNEWFVSTLAAAGAASSLYGTVTVQVVSEDGAVLFDDTVSHGANLGASHQRQRQNVTSAPIVADGHRIGTVYVSVFGSDTLLTKADQQFRARSYSAVLVASVAAVLIALVVGVCFAKRLVRPINKIAVAANEIKEGNYGARANLEGDDEVARLGKTFDAMAENVEQNRQLERRLVTDVAHELRTPLMAIQSTVEAIIDGVFEADEERLETLNSEIRRLSRLVDGLLKLSRLENRSNPIELTRVDVSELLDSIVETHTTYAADAGLTLLYEHDEGVFVLGNPDMLRQAVANLISNAVRYTPEGGTVTVRVRKGDIMAAIEVQDTGIGLSPEEAKMVFSRFWRADKGRARESGGLGIGLSVVKEIVDRHNGWVHVEGVPDEGSTFTIYIPLYRDVELKRGRKHPRGKDAKRDARRDVRRESRKDARRLLP